jgi:ATP-dependent RNA helicase SUPV3L1/SUV3
MSDTSTPPTSSAAPAPAPRPAPHPLPNARHVARLPPGTSLDGLHRIRQAAYQLPQVVAAHDMPADLVAEHAADADERMDKLGLLLLQKGVPGQRPSRWLAPSLIDTALQHLAAVGTGPKLRALMTERSGVLEALGISRAGPDSWERQATHMLHLAQNGWRVPVVFLTPLDAAPVWRFFRDGDKAALLLALRAVPDYPHATALQAALDTLVEQAGHINPGRIDSLLPGLQAECSTPQPLDSLRAACTRALDRWANRVNELDTLDDLSSELAFQGYPDSFKTARRACTAPSRCSSARPTAARRTQAFERLATCERGVYLAPLRLLALEGRDRLMARGVPCSLRTGEENVPVDGARVVSSTIEMVGTGDLIDVAVIDEAQMIFDPARLGLDAGHRRRAGQRGADHLQRLRRARHREPAGPVRRALHRAPLRAQAAGAAAAGPVPIASLKLGDAVVAFSRATC